MAYPVGDIVGNTWTWLYGVHDQTGQVVFALDGAKDLTYNVESTSLAFETGYDFKQTEVNGFAFAQVGLVNDNASDTTPINNPIGARMMTTDTTKSRTNAARTIQIFFLRMETNITTKLNVYANAL